MLSEFQLLPKPKAIVQSKQSGLRLSKLLIIYHNKHKIKDISLLISSRMNKHLGYFTDTFPIHDSFVNKNITDKYYFCCLTTEENFRLNVKEKLNKEVEERVAVGTEILETSIEETQNFAECLDAEDLKKRFKEEGYIMDIQSEAAFVIAETMSGYYHGIQTLLQILDNAIFNHHDQDSFIKIPKMTVADYPLLKLRAFHLDLKRMMHKADYINKLMEFVSKFKYNSIIVEYEDKFNYKGKLKAGRHKYHWTDEQFKTFIDICKFNQMEVIPLIQVFGHLERWLSKPEFHELREIKDQIKDSEKTHAICPLNSDAREFIFEMVDQICNAHPDSPYVHIGADEVHELGNCEKCQEFVKSHSRSELYINWINQVAERILSQGKRPMLWSDYLIKYPEAIDKLNKKIIVTYWDYASSRPVETYLWLDHLVYGSGLKNRLSKELLEYYDEYYKTDDFPNSVKMLPFYDFFMDQGLEVIGSPSVASAFKFLMPDYLQSIRNVMSHAYRAAETCNLGVFVTSWAECTNPYETQKLSIAAVSEALWNPNFIESVKGDHRPSLPEFDPNWKRLSKAVSLNVFEMIPDQSTLDVELIARASSYPRTDEILDYDKHLSWIDEAKRHINEVEDYVYEHKHAIEGMLIGLTTRAVQLKVHKIVTELRNTLKNYEESDSPTIFTEIDLDHYGSILRDAVRFFGEVQQDVIKEYVNKDIILRGETEFIFNRPKYKFVHLFKEHVPWLLDLLPKIKQRATALMANAAGSDSDIDEVDGYKGFEDILVQLSRIVLYEIK